MTCSRSLFVLVALLTTHAMAAGKDDKAREDMQKQLNNQVMSAPFNAGDIDKAEEYAAGAKAKNIQPVARPPTYWAPGWTCANLTTYAYYNYGDYRNCVYYHHYYGYYWRYR
jgi:hypothetical protein